MAEADSSGPSPPVSQSTHDSSKEPTEIAELNLSDTSVAEQNQTADLHIPQGEADDAPHTSNGQEWLDGTESAKLDKDLPVMGSTSESHSEASVHQSDWSPGGVTGNTSLSRSLSDSMDSGHLEWTLLSLPGELLLQIFDYLDPREVIRELSLVCKAIHAVVSKNLEWKVRFRKRWKGTYPIVPGTGNFHLA